MGNKIMLDRSNRDSNSNSRKSSSRLRADPLSMGIKPSCHSLSQSQVSNHFYGPKTSSENLISYGFVADKVLQRCKLLTYPGNPIEDPIYPNCEVTLPQSVMRLKKIDAARDKSKNFRPIHSYLCKGEGLFLDDLASSSDKGSRSGGYSHNENVMDNNDKINRWIESLPIFETNNNEWKSYCYYSDFAPNWETVDSGKTDGKKTYLCQ
ncbi:hypothetical protein ZYGR_0AS00830 [Zygosaccharomyces rouxii]|uniref:Uncharacterized protein n=1 Tax=Zygosaccharomyces rouxii TaxID=4956 RepID=A0A1Q3AGG2_ZYGRO|nr:hypothetical protein ZYGR_0AS00830 [Zygosaccharomyces rouxii]